MNIITEGNDKKLRQTRLQINKQKQATTFDGYSEYNTPCRGIRNALGSLSIYLYINALFLHIPCMCIKN